MTTESVSNYKQALSKGQFEIDSSLGPIERFDVRKGCSFKALYNAISQQIVDGDMNLDGFWELHTNNKRNKVYIGSFPGIQGSFFLKKQLAKPTYSFGRRVEIHLKQLFCNDSKACFDGARLLESAGIETPKALLYWSVAKGFITKDSYTLFEDFSDADSLENVLGDGGLPASIRKSILYRMGKLARRLHAVGLHHKDFNLNNILLRWDDPNDFSLILVDSDAVKSVSVGSNFFKDFQLLRIFRRLQLCDEELGIVLAGYTTGVPVAQLLRTVRFWQSSRSRPLRLFRSKLKTLVTFLDNPHSASVG